MDVSSKKIFIIGGVGCVILITLVLLVLLPEPDTDVSQLPVDITDSQNCNPYSGVVPTSTASALERCSCLIVPSERAVCESHAPAVAAYTGAIIGGDTTLCQEIADSGMKAACIKVVKSKLEYIKQQQRYEK